MKNYEVADLRKIINKTSFIMLLLSWIFIRSKKLKIQALVVFWIVQLLFWRQTDKVVDIWTESHYQHCNLFWFLNTVMLHLVVFKNICMLSCLCLIVEWSHDIRSEVVEWGSWIFEKIVKPPSMYWGIIIFTNFWVRGCQKVQFLKVWKIWSQSPW